MAIALCSQLAIANFISATHSLIAIEEMTTALSTPTRLSDTLRVRRQRLATLIQAPVVLWSGGSSARNFPANAYPFRASSHFLYFAGLPLTDTVIRLEAGRLELFMDDPTPASILWHGMTASRSEVAAHIGADDAFPLEALKTRLAEACTIAVQDGATRAWQAEWLHRPVGDVRQPHPLDLALIEAIASLRLTQDSAGIAEMRRAAAVTVEAHRAGMAATRGDRTEAQVRAAMESTIMAHGMTCAYNSIVTVRGEVLHNNHYGHVLQSGDLLLADVGAETETGWAADVTRTWPVAGQFSATQRDLYDVVLAAHDRAIEQVRPGVEYRDIHLLAATTLAAGLVDLGILRGQPSGLVESDAYSLFFPPWHRASAGAGRP